MANALDGLEAMKAVIARVTANLPQRAAAALYQEAEAIMAVSKPLAPVATGVLRAGGYVSQPVIQSDRISVEMGYGGAASEYLIAAHEHLSEHSPPSWVAAEAAGRGIHWSVPGTGPKFLENPIKEAAPFLADRIAQRIDLSTL